MSYNFRRVTLYIVGSTNISAGSFLVTWGTGVGVAVTALTADWTTIELQLDSRQG
jgi:hypothetical protein